MIISSKRDENLHCTTAFRSPRARLFTPLPVYFPLSRAQIHFQHDNIRKQPHNELFWRLLAAAPHEPRGLSAREVHRQKKKKKNSNSLFHNRVSCHGIVKLLFFLSPPPPPSSHVILLTPSDDNVEQRWSCDMSCAQVKMARFDSDCWTIAAHWRSR